jgi:hypothetical protein
MVRDNTPFSHRKKLKRKSSWKDALRGFASGGEEENTSSKPTRRNSKHNLPPQLAPSRSATGDEGNLGDAESEDEEDDFNRYREEDRPISARVKYKYPTGDGVVPRSKSALERQQLEMLVAVAEADVKAMQTFGTGKEVIQPALESKHEPIGTRLTMTSRTGYFQDRIISPSMVCIYPLW